MLLFPFPFFIVISLFSSLPLCISMSLSSNVSVNLIELIALDVKSSYFCFVDPVVYPTHEYWQYLCMRQNLIKKIEGLETLVLLHDLDLRDNELEKIEGLSTLTQLALVILFWLFISLIDSMETYSLHNWLRLVWSPVRDYLLDI